MPCLHPKLIHRHPNLTGFDAVGNRIIVPDGFKPEDEALRLVIPCHQCIECRKRRMNEWRLRLIHEHEYGGHNLTLFVTLSFSPENLPDLKFEDRSSARKLFRRVFDAFFKRYGYRPKHFFVSEHGDSKYSKHRYHYHGFIFFDPGQLCPPYSALRAFFRRYFGHTWVEKMKSTAAINYSMKYMAKEYLKLSDGDNRLCGIIVTSPGLGRGFALSHPFDIVGRLSDADRPCLIDVIGKNGCVFKLPIPSYYRALAYRLYNAHPLFVTTERAPYLIRYGPFTVMSNAPEAEITIARRSYEAYLSEFCDVDRFKMEAQKRRLARLKKRFNYIHYRDND